MAEWAFYRRNVVARILNTSLADDAEARVAAEAKAAVSAGGAPLKTSSSS